MIMMMMVSHDPCVATPKSLLFLMWVFVGLPGHGTIAQISRIQRARLCTPRYREGLRPPRARTREDRRAACCRYTQIDGTFRVISLGGLIRLSCILVLTEYGDKKRRCSARRVCRQSSVVSTGIQVGLSVVTASTAVGVVVVVVVWVGRAILL